MCNSRQSTGPAARRERARLEMQASIIDVAREIVATEGVQGLTIRGVARELGYSPGALYEYVDSKEAILTCLYFEGEDGLGSATERALADLPGDASMAIALRALGLAYRTFALDHADLYQLAFSGQHTPKTARITNDDEVDGGFGTLVRVVKRGIGDGTFSRDAQPLAIAIAAWSAVHGFVSLELGGKIAPGGDADAEHARTARDALFNTVLDMALFGLVVSDNSP